MHSLTGADSRLPALLLAPAEKKTFSALPAGPRRDSACSSPEDSWTSSWQLPLPSAALLTTPLDSDAAREREAVHQRGLMGLARPRLRDRVGCDCNNPLVTACLPPSGSHDVRDALLFQLVYFDT